MTKQRHCYVQDVGIAIEKLADALDPERKKPFGGDILNLLEWATKDVLEMRKQLSAKDAEIAMLRTGDTCARQCEGTAYRIEARSLKRQLAAAHDLLRQSRESIEWIRHRSESQRVWGGQDWKYVFPHKKIFDRATEAMEAIDKELGENGN